MTQGAGHARSVTSSAVCRWDHPGRRWVHVLRLKPFDDWERRVIVGGSSLARRDAVEKFRKAWQDHQFHGTH